ncbi:hypothetical protein SUDANB121_03818 [Nocardiopsis dassonvillei]
MGAVTLAALVAAAWAAVLALTAAEPFSCALTSGDVAANHCNRAAGRFAALSPAAVLLLLLPPAAGVALGWRGLLRGSPGGRAPTGAAAAEDRRAGGAWGWVAAGGALVLVGPVGCALLWASLAAAGPEL